MDIASAKSLLLFAYGASLKEIIERMQNTLIKFESGEETDCNCLAADLQVEWDSSPKRHTALYAFLYSSGNKDEQPAPEQIAATRIAEAIQARDEARAERDAAIQFVIERETPPPCEWSNGWCFISVDDGARCASNEGPPKSRPTAPGGLAMETRTVTIPKCAEHEGYCRNLMTVELPWVCIHCGGKRGEPYETLSYDGSRRLNVHGWKNDCGHVETYSAIRDWLLQQRREG